MTQRTRGTRHTPPRRQIEPAPTVALHDVDAQSSLLGATLHSPALMEAADGLAADDLWGPFHPQVWSVMCELRAAGQSCDIVSVAAGVRDLGGGDRTDSLELLKLSAPALSPSAVRTWAGIIRAKAAQRRTYVALAEAITAVESGGTPDLEAITRAAESSDSGIDRSPAAQIRARTLSLAELDDLPPQQWLVPGIISATGLGIMWGRSQAYKSFLSVDLAMRVSAGLEVWGEPAERRRVLYIAGEGAGGIGKRMRAWRIRNGTAREDHAIDVLTMAPPMADEDRAWADALAREAARRGSQLVVIDTVARAFGSGSENDTGDMNRFVSACDRVWQATGGVVMGVHHSGHDKTRMRGNSALFAACDFVLAVDRPSDLHATLSNRDEDAGKTKDDAPLDEPLAFRMDIVETGHEDRRGAAVTSLVPRPIDPEDMPEPERKSNGDGGRKVAPQERLLDLAKGLRLLDGTISSGRELGRVLECSPDRAFKIIQVGLDADPPKIRKVGTSYVPTDAFVWKAD